MISGSPSQHESEGGCLAGAKARKHAVTGLLSSTEQFTLRIPQSHIVPEERG
jgi:hypothetical protein